MQIHTRNRTDRDSGFFLSSSAFCTKLQLLAQWDAQTFLLLHTRMRRYASFFRYIWPLGTVPVGITLILIMFMAGWQAGLIAALMYLAAAIVEWAIKRKVNRPRPFETLPGVVMSQPKNPSDASHPSGDTMRVWFLALRFPAGLWAALAGFRTYLHRGTRPQPGTYCPGCALSIRRHRRRRFRYPLHRVYHHQLLFNYEFSFIIRFQFLGGPHDQHSRNDPPQIHPRDNPYPRAFTIIRHHPKPIFPIASICAWKRTVTVF